MAMGTTQPLTEMSTRCISWGKGGRCVRLTTLPPSCAVVMKSGILTFLEPSGLLHACNGTALYLPLPLVMLDIVVGTVTRLLTCRWIDFRVRKQLQVLRLFFRATKLALGPNQTRRQW
jgi:hypothetical protein